MKTNRNAFTIIAVSVAPLMLNFFCIHAEIHEEQNQNLQAIVDLNEVLDQASPSHFAAQTFKDCFDENTAPKKHLKVREKVSESKTAFFQQSLVKYIKEIYNKRNYADFLSQDGSDIIQFLEISNELNLSSEMVYVGLRLFHNKIKAAELIDDTVVIQLLNSVPRLLERHFSQHDDDKTVYDLTFIKNSLENMLLSKFTDHIELFKTQPDQFLSNLASDLASYYQQEADKIKKQVRQDETRERLRHLVIRFFETMLTKAIWTPQTPENIWPSFTSIANGVQLLGDYNIIDHMDYLDDLLWGLTHRFSFFLDLTGAALPINFYENIEQALEDRTVFFLEYKEQDEGISTKKETFIDAFVQAKARALAYHHNGIISMPIKGL